jgi:thiamine-phosphate diphosphorylase
MDTRIRGLYVIIDPAACRGRHPVQIARQAIDGGASVVQWRDKLRDKGDQLADASAIEGVCRSAGVLFIVNDHADLTLAVGAAGVHVGPHDLPVERVRSIVGDAMIIGASTNNAREALTAQQDGADYVAVGAIFPTGTKGDTRPANLDRIREVKSAVRLPVVAIGGINASNIASVIEAGADAAAVISAVCGADDPAEATRRLATEFPVFPDSRQAAAQPTANDVHALVERYAALFNAGDRDAWVALFAEHGLQHDPVGEPPRRGRAEIAAWWERAVAPYEAIIMEPKRITVNGSEAALVWRIVERLDGKQRAFEGIDIITLDAQGLISEIRAYWDRSSLPDFA